MYDKNGKMHFPKLLDKGLENLGLDNHPELKHYTHQNMFVLKENLKKKNPTF